ncbi:MAG: hypothetical protein U1E72_06815 [Burkholderiaceae bacterium]
MVIITWLLRLLPVGILAGGAGGGAGRALGYSVNESVVIFDRIRKTFKSASASSRPPRPSTTPSPAPSCAPSSPRLRRRWCCRADLQRATLHYFALALTVGILFSIYSSVFVAAAIAMWLGIKREISSEAKDKEIEPNDPNSGAVV